MAKPNYQFEKRMREKAKKQKQEEKALRKEQARTAPSDINALPNAEVDLPPKQ